ncbi:MAG: hypothetical protein IJ870_02395 [Alphaproteobacteria bacterium]|nr:hypothetical protein [Alphaproteobacteria bacterium]
MYLWVVLATFMVALLSFNLSIRPDADRAYMEIKAQTVVTKFRAQHFAFKHFIESKKLTLAEQYSDNPNLIKNTVDYVSGVGYNDGKILGTINDAIKVEDIQHYLPYGFQTDTKIFSKVFCFKPNQNQYDSDANFARVCEDDDTISDPFLKGTCCAAPGIKVFVISWQEMPSRWLNHTTGRPLSDMMSVITKSDGFGSSFGYITNVENVSGAVVSGGMYRTLGEEKDDKGNATGKYVHEIKYRPVFDVLKSDKDFQVCMKNDKIQNPCLIAINQVLNREEK